MKYSEYKDHADDNVITNWIIPCPSAMSTNSRSPVLFD